ncbi:MAG: EAL domain-containing protein [Comamonas sp.]|nr:EAL domain-containing protein [Comamonas sp.]
MQGQFFEAKNRLSMRYALRFACIWMSALGAVVAAAGLFTAETALAALSLLLIPLAVLTQALLRSQHWQAATLLFCWGNWALATATIGGSGGMAAMAFPVWLVIAVWLLGTTQALCMLGLSALALLLFWTTGYLDAAAHNPGLAALLYALGSLGLAAAITLMARLSLSHRAQKSLDMLALLEESQQELRKFHRAVEQSPESIVITDTALNVIYVNDAFLARTGYAREEVLGQPTELVSTMGMDRSHRRRALEQLASGAVWRGEMSNRTRSGEALRESVLVAPIRSSQGQVVNYVELKHDLSERVLADRRIHDLVYLDPLTGLPNRHSLVLHLRELATGAQSACHGLLLLDVDRFSVFRDAHGMQHSDELVRAVGMRLVEALPDNVWIARLAGAEFAMLFENLEPHGQAAEQRLRQQAQALKLALQKPLHLRGRLETESVSCCMGAALLEPGAGGADQQEVLRFASVALHEAKQNGPGSVMLFEPRMAEEVHKRMRIARDLRSGIPLGELRLYLQTQATARGVCVGAEVLVRWQHPQWGLLSPVEFIEVAEESELILDLGGWVLRQACLLLAQPVFAERGLRLSVNVSAIQFGHEGFMPALQAVLRDTGANPHLLTLELTEGVLLRDWDEARTRILALRELGIEIALDDFGTGYSSMYSLKQLPIQELKIDRGFVSGSHGSATDAALVEAMLLLARRLHLRVVAEGVELPVQAERLQQWNPDIVMQGLLLGEPLPQQQWLAEVLGAPDSLQQP